MFAASANDKKEYQMSVRNGGDIIHIYIFLVTLYFIILRELKKNASFSKANFCTFGSLRILDSKAKDSRRIRRFTDLSVTKIKISSRAFF